MSDLNPVNRLADLDLKQRTAKVNRQPRPTAPLANGDNGQSHPQRAAAPPSANGSNGRDSFGRFAKGYRGGPGNPFARQVAAIRRDLLTVVSRDDLHAILRRLRDRARDGDVAAVKVLFSYIVGRPAETVDPDTLDQKEWLQHQNSGVTAQAMLHTLNTMPTEIACLLVREVLPVLSMKIADHVREKLGLGAKDEPAKDGGKHQEAP